MLAREAEHEVAEAESRVASVGEIQQAVERAQIDVVDQVAAALDAELVGVLAAAPRQVAGELVDLRGLDCGLKNGPPSRVIREMFMCGTPPL